MLIKLCTLCVHMSDTRAAQKLPLTRLLRFIFHTLSIPLFWSSLTSQLPSSVYVTSRTIAIRPFFIVAHCLCSSITVCCPSSVCTCTAILLVIQICVFVPLPTEALSALCSLAKQRKLFVNASILSAFPSLCAHHPALNIKIIYCVTSMCECMALHQREGAGAVLCGCICMQQAGLCQPHAE